MGNRPSTANIFQGNSSNRGKFWRRKSSSKTEHYLNGGKGVSNKEDGQPSSSGGNRRASLYQQSNNKNGGILRSLRKSKSEKANEVFASSDLPLLDNDSVDSSAMSSGNTNQKNNQENGGRNYQKFYHRANRPAASYFCSSASTSSRLQQRLTIGMENGHKRRVKSFRHFPSSRGGTINNNLGGRSSAAACCPITGLSQVQKRLILGRWRQKGDPNKEIADLLAVCFSVFQRIFENQPQLSALILRTCRREEQQNANNSDDCVKSRDSIKPMKLHVERFCQTLHYALIGLEESIAAVHLEQILLDYGASHAAAFDSDDHNPIIIPALYWDSLLLHLSDVGQQQTQTIVDKQQIGNLQRNPLVDSLDRRPLASAFPPHFHSRRSTEAWQLFCIFLISKIRFGYEMECFLRDCYRRMMAKTLTKKTKEVRILEEEGEEEEYRSEEDECKSPVPTKKSSL